jgi:hypothetical protein
MACKHAAQLAAAAGVPHLPQQVVEKVVLLADDGGRPEDGGAGHGVAHSCVASRLAAHAAAVAVQASANVAADTRQWQAC